MASMKAVEALDLQNVPTPMSKKDRKLMDITFWTMLRIRSRVTYFVRFFVKMAYARMIRPKFHAWQKLNPPPK